MLHRMTKAGSVVALCASVPALGGVTIESRYDVEAPGPMGVFASSGTTITRVSGPLSRTASVTKSKSQLVKTLSSGSSETTSITRIDLEVVQDLQPKKSQYTETTFEQMRQMMAQGLAELGAMQTEGMGQPAQGQSLPVSDQTCIWDEGETDFEKTGDKENIADLKTERFTIRHARSCTDKETGAVCTLTWSMDQWMAKKAPGGKEVQRFWNDFADAMELEDFGQQRNTPGLQAIIGMFQEGWDETLAEASAMRGYPMKSITEVRIGGENCTMADGQQIASSELFADAATAAQNAAVDQAAAETGNVIAESTATMAGGGVGGRIAGSAVGAFGKQMAGGLFGGMKKDKKKQSAADTPAAVQGEVLLFRITNETTSIVEGDIDETVFEIPAGWTRIEQPAWPGAVSR